MIVLNVLPPSLKEEIKVNRVKSVVNSVAAVALALLLVSGGALAANVWISGLLADVTAESTEVMQSNEEILAFNKKISKIQNVQNMFHKYSEAFIPVLNAIPDGVTVTNLSFDGEHKILTIEGNTSQKSLIFETRDNIQALEMYSDVRLITDELITKTRKTFTINATVLLPSL